MTKRFKKIILHAGMPKTGTSTIQMFLKNKRQNLEEENGILYPVVEDDPRPFKENHSIWVTSLFSKTGHTTPVNINFGFNTVEKLKVRNNKTINALHEMFDNSKSDTLLISAEGISTIDADGIMDLFSWLDSLGEEIKMLLCIRHPKDGISSETQQKIKTGKTIEHLISNPQIALNKKVLNCALKAIGKSNITVFDFHTAKTSKRGIIGSFLDHANIKSSVNTGESKSTLNTSMSLEAALLYSILNKTRPKYINGKIGPKRFGKDLKFFLSLKGTKFSLPECVFKKFESKISDELSWVKQEFDVSLKWSQGKNQELKEKDFFTEFDSTLATIGIDQHKIQSLLKSYFDMVTAEEEMSENSELELKQMVFKISDFLNNEELNRLQRKLKNLETSDDVLLENINTQISNLL